MPLTIWVIPFTHGLVADCSARVEEDRPDVVLDQLPFDLPYQPPPLLRVGLHRLPVDQRIDLIVAVSALAVAWSDRQSSPCNRRRKLDCPENWSDPQTSRRGSDRHPAIATANARSLA
jgi:hypothetical protein